MSKKQRLLYGLRIGVDGEIRRVRIPMEGKWRVITGLLETTATERHAAGGFNGVNRIAVCDRYAAADKKENPVATRLCGKPIHGTAILLRENSLGFPALMTDGAAYRMQLEVERGW